MGQRRAHIWSGAPHVKSESGLPCDGAARSNAMRFSEGSGVDAVTEGSTQAKGAPPELRAVELSRETAARRHALMEAYAHDVYIPAFPDAVIREDPRYWVDLLDAAEPPPPPQPRIEVVLLLDAEDHPVAGVTIEYYRAARIGLLTYIAVAEGARGKGIGRRLIAAARAWLDRTADAATPMLAETERYQDAHDDAERGETDLRQKRLAGLGARMLDFDYVMPPLRPELPPYRLHLMCFLRDGEGRDSLRAPQVAAFLRELAAALGADLAAHADTADMMAALETRDTLHLLPLPRAKG